MSFFQHDLFAPVENSDRRATGAKSAPVVGGAYKGTGTGAKVRQLRTPTGAQPSVPVSHTRLQWRASRIEVVKKTLRELARESAALMPSVASYQREVSGAREAIRESLEAVGPMHGRRERIRQHDRILNAAIQWGADKRQHAYVERLIKAFSNELTELTKSEKAK